MAEDISRISWMMQNKTARRRDEYQVDRAVGSRAETMVILRDFAWLLGWTSARRMDLDAGFPEAEFCLAFNDVVGKPYLLIVAEPLDTMLPHVQLMTEAHRKGFRWLVATNGETWKISDLHRGQSLCLQNILSTPMATGTILALTADAENIADLDLAMANAKLLSHAREVRKIAWEADRLADLPHYMTLAERLGIETSRESLKSLLLSVAENPEETRLGGAEALLAVSASESIAPPRPMLAPSTDVESMVRSVVAEAMEPEETGNIAAAPDLDITTTFGKVYVGSPRGDKGGAYRLRRDSARHYTLLAGSRIALEVSPEMTTGKRRSSFVFDAWRRACEVGEAVQIETIYGPALEVKKDVPGLLVSHAFYAIYGTTRNSAGTLFEEETGTPWGKPILC